VDTIAPRTIRRTNRIDRTRPIRKVCGIVAFSPAFAGKRRGFGACLFEAAQAQTSALFGPQRFGEEFAEEHWAIIFDSADLSEIVNVLLCFAFFSAMIASL
jgi:hypothetical protein